MNTFKLVDGVYSNHLGSERKKTMFWLTVIVVIASLFSGSLWAILIENSQQAFGIVECVLGAHGVLMVALYNYC